MTGDVLDSAVTLALVWQAPSPSMESGQIQLWPNFWLDLPDVSAAAVHSTNYD